jgi:DNA polymerase-1
MFAIMTATNARRDNHKLFLLDAYALIYRAYFAFIANPLRNSKGMNVSAIAGFTQLLHDLIQKEKPTHMAVVFDSAEEETTRAIEYEFYKANRQPMPEDIAQSIPWIKQIVAAMKIPVIEMAGYEADDIIGTLAKQKARQGHLVYMVTTDKDYAQLVEDNIKIYKPGRQGSEVEILGTKEVLEKWEVERADQVIDILGLWGDSIDNIPGIPGIGEKTAKKLIKEYGSLENIIANADKITGKLGENIKTHAEQGIISKHLATIILDVPIQITDEDLLVDEPDKEALAALFAELEFRNLGKKILGDDFSIQRGTAAKSSIGTSTTHAAAQQENLFGAAVEVQPISTYTEKGKNIQNTPHHYVIASDDIALKNEETRVIPVQELIEKLEQADEFCFDTETSSLDYFDLDVVGLSFSIQPGEAFYVPCPPDRNDAKRLVQRFKHLLESEHKLKIGQNIKFDMHVLRHYGVCIAEPIYDTMLAHYLIEPDMKHNMDYLSETYLGYTPIHIDELIGKKGKNQASMKEVPLLKIAEYAAEDADITLQLKHVFAPMVKQRAVENVLHEIEHPLVAVLTDMEHEGVKIDSDFLRDYSKTLQTDLLALQQRIFDYAGQEFNIDSPKQLGEILYHKMKLPFEGKKTSTGQLSTNEEALQALIKHHPIAAAILEFREVGKLKNTYVDALPKMVHPKTGRVHTTFNQTIAATGRLSSVSPNLQNIPIRTDRGQQVRKAFVARDENHLLLSADYSQIELRLVAEISQDAAMLEAFDQGMDIHLATAAKVYGIAPSQVTKSQRNSAKMVNFGIIYAISPFGLSQRLGIGRKEAAELIENYFKQFPGIRKYMDDTLRFAREHGYVQTIKGRKRFLKDINSRNFTVRGFAEREAINAPIQGSAADMIKIAMINIHREFKTRKLKSKMTLQVHDELVFDAHKSEIDVITSIIREKMIRAIETRVPIVVEMGTGTNWLEAH